MAISEASDLDSVHYMALVPAGSTWGSHPHRVHAWERRLYPRETQEGDRLRKVEGVKPVCIIRFDYTNNKLKQSFSLDTLQW